MTSEYDAIFSVFLSKVEDFDLIELEENTAYEMMTGWLHSTVAIPHVRSLFSSISYNDNTENLTWELKWNYNDDTDTDFVQEVLAQGMVIKWLEPKVKSVLNVRQMYSNKEQKFYSQANHMAELKEMLSQAKTDLKKIIRDYGYIHNGYVGDTI